LNEQLPTKTDFTLEGFFAFKARLLSAKINDLVAPCKVVACGGQLEAGFVFYDKAHLVSFEPPNAVTEF
jgi:hypothetical protein